MNINARVRVIRGQYRGTVGTIEAICDNYEYLIDTGSKLIWVVKTNLEQI